MPYGRCQLCDEYHQLCNSHALPDALFRPILKKNSGKAIRAVDDETTPTSHTTDSWDTHQLCSACEERMNSQYDSYGISVFKGRKGRVQRTSTGISISGIECIRVRMFLLSVLWRMSKSAHHAYLNTLLPPRIQADLQTSLCDDRPYSASKLHIAVYRLHDFARDGKIESELFRDFVISPFLRRSRRSYSIVFIVFGFLIEICVPGLQLRHRKAASILSPNSTTMFAPLVDFSKVPEILELAVRLRWKEINGVSHITDD